MLADFRGGTALTPSGHVRVTPSLNIQFPGDIVAENMFAIGDIIDWPERHMIIGAKLQADVVFKNLLAALELVLNLLRRRRTGERQQEASRNVKLTREYLKSTSSYLGR